MATDFERLSVVFRAASAGGDVKMKAGLRRAKRCGLIAVLACIVFGGVVSALPAFAALGQLEPTEAQTEWWGKFSNEVDLQHLERDVEELTSFSPAWQDTLGQIRPPNSSLIASRHWASQTPATVVSNRSCPTEKPTG